MLLPFVGTFDVTPARTRSFPRSTRAPPRPVPGWYRRDSLTRTYVLPTIFNLPVATYKYHRYESEHGRSNGSGKPKAKRAAPSAPLSPGVRDEKER